jgi:molecular chaperone GrpE
MTDETTQPSTPSDSTPSSAPPASEGGLADTDDVPTAQTVAPDALSLALAEAAKYKDMALRGAADFDNYRKRARREVDDARKGGREDLLKEFLPVFDNLERGLQSAQRATDIKGVVDGLSMVLKQFESTLGRAGITKVPTTGSPFDPSVHEAIQQVETAEHAPGTVVAEVQPGYTSGERLIRAAMVVVAKAKAEAAATEPS